MAEHRTRLSWARNDGPFERGNYVPDHAVRFQGGQTVHVSSAPDFGGNAAHADPEQLLLSALSSCHMLTFLAVVANRGYVLEEYTDDAEAFLGKDEQNRTVVTRANLRPRVRFSGEKQPTSDEIAQWHARAHKACFIANSVRTDVSVEPVFA